MPDAAHEAMRYAKGRSRRDLEADTMLARALVNCLAVVGEAAARVTQDTRSRGPSIPWARIVGMRNRLIHAYFDIDQDAVWKTITEDLPALANRLQAMLDAAERQQ
jgi:uncharacterized protein with HEPN domain